MYIINLKNGSYQNLNRQNALKNNAILSIGVDKEKDLWLGLDNGICHVEINSPVQVFSDSSGILGSVYSLSTIDNGYLFVTNHGIFTSKNKILEVLPNSQGQVWDIYKRGNEFIIGHNDGTFLYDGRTARLQKVSPINGGWKFLKGEFENVYFQGNYAGIVVYEDINDLSKYKLLAGLKNLSRIWPRTNVENYGRQTITEVFTGFYMIKISMSKKLKMFHCKTV